MISLIEQEGQKPGFLKRNWKKLAAGAGAAGAGYMLYNKLKDGDETSTIKKPNIIDDKFEKAKAASIKNRERRSKILGKNIVHPTPNKMRSGFTDEDRKKLGSIKKTNVIDTTPKTGQTIRKERIAGRIAKTAKENQNFEKAKAASIKNRERRSKILSNKDIANLHIRPDPDRPN